MIGRLVAGLFLVVLVAGCENYSGGNDSLEEVSRATYRHDGPPAITLYTMINTRSGAGAHTSMMINASQRVIFDPAGTVDFRDAPEINDVLYGITPPIAEAFESAHARETYYVRIQRIEVSAATAEMALRLAQQSGPVSASRCTRATAEILQRLPGFESIRPVLFPTALADQVAGLPGVTERTLVEDDADDKNIAITLFEQGVPPR